MKKKKYSPPLTQKCFFLLHWLFELHCAEWWKCCSHIHPLMGGIFCAPFKSEFKTWSQEQETPGNKNNLILWGFSMEQQWKFKKKFTFLVERKKNFKHVPRGTLHMKCDCNKSWQMTRSNLNTAICMLRVQPETAVTPGWNRKYKRLCV